MLPVCQRYGMGVIPWSPLAGGWLSGGFRKGQESPEPSGPAACPPATTCRYPGNQRKLEAVEALAQLAEKSGMSLIHLALAFVIRHPGVTSAIIGPRTMEHLESQLGAADVDADRRGPRRHRPDRAARHHPQAVERGWEPPSLTDASLRRR